MYTLTVTSSGRCTCSKSGVSNISISSHSYNTFFLVRACAQVNNVCAYYKRLLLLMVFLLASDGRKDETERSFYWGYIVGKDGQGGIRVWRVVPRSTGVLCELYYKRYIYKYIYCTERDTGEEQYIVYSV